MTGELFRKYSDDATYGELTVGDSVFYTVELPWKDNEREVSCIPEGEYDVVIHDSPKFGRCYWLKNVEDRSEILIHPANFVSELLGCIAPGMDQRDLDGDGIIDNVSSRKAMKKLLTFEITKLIIRS